LLSCVNEISDKLKKFVMIAPPSNLFDFSGFNTIKQNGFVIHGTEDDVVPVSYTDNLMKDIIGNISYLKIEGAGHFFEGYESKLSSAITSFLQK